MPNKDELQKLLKYSGYGAAAGGAACVLLFIYQLFAKTWNCLCNCIGGCKTIPVINSAATFLFVFFICFAIGLIIGIFLMLRERSDRLEYEAQKEDDQNSDKARNQRKQWAAEIKRNASKVADICEKNADDCDIFVFPCKSDSLMNDIFNEFADAAELKVKVDSLLNTLKTGRNAPIYRSEPSIAYKITDDDPSAGIPVKNNGSVSKEYERLARLVKNGKYDEALALSETVLEKMPFCPDVFWLRLLAGSRCDSTEALIRKGVICEKSADYCNAVRFATGTQKADYTGTAAKITAVRKLLIQSVKKHHIAEMKSANISGLLSGYSDEIDSRREKLFGLFKELSQTESQISAIEKNCLLLLNEYKEAAEKSRSEAASFKSKTSKIKECSAEDYHMYQIKFSYLLNQSNDAKNSVDSLNRHQHPWSKKYSSLCQEYKSIVSQITREINSLKAYEEKIQSAISKAEEIDSKHREALASMAKSDFSQVRSLIGEKLFSSAFSEAGIN